MLYIQKKIFKACCRQDNVLPTDLVGKSILYELTNLTTYVKCAKMSSNTFYSPINNPDKHS